MKSAIFYTFVGLLWAIATSRDICAQTPVNQDVACETIAPPTSGPVKVEVTVDRSDALYKVGESVTFHICLVSNGKLVKGQQVSYLIRGEHFFSQSGRFEEGAKDVTVSLKEPGFLLCEAFYRPTEDREELVGRWGVGVDPLGIKAETPEPRDFDEFWKRQMQELAKVPVRELERIPVEVNDPVYAGKVQLFDVKISCSGDKSVSGYLALPVNASKSTLPIVVRFHGAGVDSARANLEMAAKGTIVFDINAHGIPNGRPPGFYQELEKGALLNYYMQGNASRETAYFRGMFLRAVRAVQYVQGLPEWDQRNLIAYGGSQGGAQALVAAALAPKVSHCFAAAPWLCNFTGVTEGTVPASWPGFIKMNGQEVISKSEASALPYFDPAIFAKRIQVKSVLSVAFCDRASPPASVYVAYNNIPGDKEIIDCVGEAHTGPMIYKKCGDALRRLLDDIQQKKTALGLSPPQSEVASKR
jgi:cephalosporin-C deacetylase